MEKKIKVIVKREAISEYRSQYKLDLLSQYKVVCEEDKFNSSFEAQMTTRYGENPKKDAKGKALPWMDIVANAYPY